MSNIEQPGRLRRAIASAADLALDGTALGGAGLITYGSHLIYHPAGFIVAGLFCLGGAWLAARTAGRTSA